MASIKHLMPRKVLLARSYIPRIMLVLDSCVS